MKRTRSTASSIHVCPYEECGKSFRSIRALTTHKKSHEADAPLQCTQKKCSRTFAVDSDRQAHIRQAHSPNVASRTRKRRQASAVQLVEGSAAADSAAELPSGRKSERKASDANVSPTNKGSNAEDEENSDKEIDASQSLVTEADEIVENAEYLASQMKVARVCSTLSFLNYIILYTLYAMRPVHRRILTYR